MAVYGFRNFGKGHLINQFKFGVSTMLAKDHSLRCQWPNKKASEKRTFMPYGVLTSTSPEKTSIDIVLIEAAAHEIQRSAAPAAAPCADAHIRAVGPRTRAAAAMKRVGRAAVQAVAGPRNAV